jgi:NAD(P)-dependent dehydrogenase (short-subunit alcohol dehydrogenase family)
LDQPTILITGASTGIGRASAEHLARHGYRVLAGVRSSQDVDALQRLALPGLTPVRLDVTREPDVRAIADELAEDPRGLYALVNNAGHNYNSAFEYADEARARSLWEVNYFGLVHLSRALIPHLRRSAETAGRPSKLVNVSSIGGSFGLPWEVHYHASKFAVNGLTEGLRMELWQQGIRAVVVQPGGIRTEFMPKTDASIAQALSVMPEEGQRRYGPGLSVLRRRIEEAGRFGSEPLAVAKVLARILARRSPGFRWIVGFDARLLSALHALLPDSWVHAMFRKMFGS